jgi:hypothetical protein
MKALRTALELDPESADAHVLGKHTAGAAACRGHSCRRSRFSASGTRILVHGKGDPPAISATIENLDNPQPEELVPLNFKVVDSFRREFKIFSATNGMHMV